MERDKELIILSHRLTGLIGYPARYEYLGSQVVINILSVSEPDKTRAEKEARMALLKHADTIPSWLVFDDIAVQPLSLDDIEADYPEYYMAGMTRSMLVEIIKLEATLTEVVGLPVTCRYIAGTLEEPATMDITVAVPPSPPTKGVRDKLVRYLSTDTNVIPFGLGYCHFNIQLAYPEPKEDKPVKDEEDRVMSESLEIRKAMINFSYTLTSIVGYPVRCSFTGDSIGVWVLVVPGEYKYGIGSEVRAILESRSVEIPCDVPIGRVAIAPLTCDEAEKAYPQYAVKGITVEMMVDAIAFSDVVTNATGYPVECEWAIKDPADLSTFFIRVNVITDSAADSNESLRALDAVKGYLKDNPFRIPGGLLYRDLSIDVTGNYIEDLMVAPTGDRVSAAPLTEGRKTPAISVAGLKGMAEKLGSYVGHPVKVVRHQDTGRVSVYAFSVPDLRAVVHSKIKAWLNSAVRGTGLSIDNVDIQVCDHTETGYLREDGGLDVSKGLIQRTDNNTVQVFSSNSLDEFIADNRAFKAAVTSICNEVRDMLVTKNRKYGNSALDPARIFSSADAIEQLKVRIDDKLSRIRNQQGDEDEDVIMDLMGYLVLLRMALAREKGAADAELE